MRKIIPPFENVLSKTIKFADDMYFNPVIDANGILVISEEEYVQIDASIVQKYGFLKNMQYIDWAPPIRIIQDGEV